MVLGVDNGLDSGLESESFTKVNFLHDGAVSTPYGRISTVECSNQANGLTSASEEGRANGLQRFSSRIDRTVPE